MHVNNEIGTVQDIDKFAHIAKDKNILFHIDAAQSIGKISLDLRKVKADFVSLSAHKSYGPKGIGALFVRNKALMCKLSPMIFGGGQQNNIRSGTLAPHQVIGMGEAFKLAYDNFRQDRNKFSSFRKKIEAELWKVPGLSINVPTDQAVQNILSITFDSIDASVLVSALNEFAVGVGSACSNNIGYKNSHVLKAIGKTKEKIQNTIRISFGRNTTIDEIEKLLASLKRISILTQ
jgi:cysteine desulfurase